MAKITIFLYHLISIIIIKGVNYLMVKKAKKRVRKTSARTKSLRNAKKRVKTDKCFVLADGKVISSLKELALELDKMGDHIFYYHVNDSRNDFSNWIRDVIKEMELAEKVMDVKEKHDFQLHLLKHIVKLV